MEHSEAKSRQLAGLIQYKPGQSGNPGGKPVNLRNSLNARFLKALSAEFEEHGRDAIRAVREKDPSTFIKVLAALQPKEMEITRIMDQVTDEQLEAAYIAAKAIAEAAHGPARSITDSGSGAELPEQTQPTEVLQTL